METRRHFLKRGVSWTLGAIASGYIGFRVAAHNGWILVTRNARSFSKGIEPSPAIESQSVSLLVVGDTGKPTLARTSVIAAMRDYLRRHRCDATLLLGDNFYESGVESVDDPRFSEDFDDLFDKNSFPMPFYVALGNHDYGGNVEAQVEYSALNKRWKMTARYYKCSLQHANVTVDLFVTDTNQLLEECEAADEQLEWLRQELEQCTADWRIVVGHHPVLTGGRHEISPAVAVALGPILEQCNVDFYLSGHDHDLQLLDSGRGWRQIVSGAGCKLRSTAWIKETVFAKACSGFASLALSATQSHVSFYSTDARLITASYTRSSRTAHSRS